MVELSRLSMKESGADTMRRLHILVLLVPALIASALAQGGPDLAGASRPRPQMNLGSPEGQYKRIHQFALRLILLLRYEEARSFLQEHLEGHPRDSETHYLMAVWHARQGEFEESARWMRKALDFGLPPGRVVAGPRALFRGAVESSDWYREQSSRFDHQLVHGPLLGNLTHDGASFWVRTADSARVEVQVNRTGGERVRSAGEGTGEDRDGTAVVRVEGLRPGTDHDYRVLVDGRDSGHGGSFRTLVPPGSAITLRLAFGGGAGFVPPHERAWTTIESFSPDIMLLLGDNVYIDDPESRIMQRYTYHRRQSRPEWRKLTASTAVFTIWDDHDFSTNDSWGGPETFLPFWKPHFVYPVFVENWANPGYGGGPEQPGCWYAFRTGDIDFVMLDCRYYRTNPRQPDPTMLGPVQMAWLKETLEGLTGTFKVLCSSVPWDFRTKGDSLDTWNGFKAEREEIFSHIEENDIEGVLLVSADRHRSDAWRIERPEGYDLHEFNSSRLTNQHVHKEMKEAIFSYNRKQSFGLVDFDTTRGDPLATYRVVSIDGEIVHTLQVRRSMLRR